MAVSRYASERYPDAAETALGAVAIGAPIADTLQAAFPTMSRSVAVQFARTVGSSGEARQIRNAPVATAEAAGIPADRVTVDTGLQVQAEYTVIYTIEGFDGSEYKLPVVVDTLPHGSTEEQILAAADLAASVMTDDDFPQYETELEEARTEGTQILSSEIVRGRINPIH